MSSSRSSSPNSLFSVASEARQDVQDPQIACRNAPDIPGLWVFPALLPDDVARDTLNAIAAADLFSGGERDQVMLFEGPRSLPSSTDREAPSASGGLPSYINTLHGCLHDLLGISSKMTEETMKMLFKQDLARQVILNLYPPGAGITPHVDLPNRYADGIIGCSLIGGCTMILSKDDIIQRVYMPPRTVYVLSEEARWEWKHGIEGRMEDVVRTEDGGSETILRDLRVSVTFRWMKEGADLLS
ncbi:uncharacterized protein I303_101862 [Kwoniella dejecticola CBS 10117]|uniref:Fe2OG dioxygenase domain-containing protein n=1 Tax=Kwoniella dejecticola CBS 10117 TaxID=1296121 RepID=A0A1A6ACK3_9TREE|nr:uncharacterized protein I303_02002 [Kwoniella dejecticola CBS 10117]OBR87789.1 hypothetical protein I303_02002 [Kwoniella dejecticola CBS 10117]